MKFTNLFFRKLLNQEKIKELREVHPETGTAELVATLTFKRESEDEFSISLISDTGEKLVDLGIFVLGVGNNVTLHRMKVVQAISISS